MSIEISEFPGYIATRDISKNGRNVRAFAQSADAPPVVLTKGKKRQAIGVFIPNWLFNAYKQSHRSDTDIETVCLSSRDFSIQAAEAPLFADNEKRAYIITFWAKEEARPSNMLLVSPSHFETIKTWMERNEITRANCALQNLHGRAGMNLQKTAGIHISHKAFFDTSARVTDAAATNTVVIRKDRKIAAIPPKLTMPLRQFAFPNDASKIFNVSAGDLNRAPGKITTQVAEENRFAQVMHRQRHSDKETHAYTIVPAYLLEFLTMSDTGELINGITTDRCLNFIFNIEASIKTDLTNTTTLALAPEDTSQINMIGKALSCTEKFPVQGINLSRRYTCSPGNQRHFSFDDTLQIGVTLHVSGEVALKGINSTSSPDMTALALQSSKAVQINFHGQQFHLAA